MTKTLQNMVRDLHRDFIGFEPLLNELLTYASTEDGSYGSVYNTGKYPPYNLVKQDEDNYLISVAVAGFSEEDINVTVDNNSLIIEGNKSSDSGNTVGEYLYQGIANRSFKRMFRLGEFIEIGDVVLKDGILNVHLYRHIPENMKPKKIEVKRAD